MNRKNHTINRREFLQTTGLLTISAMAPTLQAAKAKQPNILFITTDQQFADALSCTMGRDYIETPNIDSLAAGGMLLSTASRSIQQKQSTQKNFRILGWCFARQGMLQVISASGICHILLKKLLQKRVVMTRDLMPSTIKLQRRLLSLLTTIRTSLSLLFSP
jgi:hypothetical protein